MFPDTATLHAIHMVFVQNVSFLSCISGNRYAILTGQPAGHFFQGRHTSGTYGFSVDNDSRYGKNAMSGHLTEIRDFFYGDGTAGFPDGRLDGFFRFMASGTARTENQDIHDVVLFLSNDVLKKIEKPAGQGEHDRQQPQKKCEQPGPHDLPQHEDFRQAGGDGGKAECQYGTCRKSF